MHFKNIAPIFALAVLSLQAGCTQAAPATGLATTERIHACITETANMVDIPQVRAEGEGGFVKRYGETEDAEVFIHVSVDNYRADDPSRETDQVNFFATYSTQGVEGPIEIYRGKQISFDAAAFYPYAPNEEGHAYYAHRQEIEYGRNFTPTAQEKLIEDWVYRAVEAMDQNFKTCMGFETEGAEVTIPQFPELNSP